MFHYLLHVHTTGAVWRALDVVRDQCDAPHSAAILSHLHGVDPDRFSVVVQSRCNLLPALRAWQRVPATFAPQPVEYGPVLLDAMWSAFAVTLTGFRVLAQSPSAVPPCPACGQLPSACFCTE